MDLIKLFEKAKNVKLVDKNTISLIEKQRVGGFLSDVLNDNTLGKQAGECVLFGAPSGQGKTTYTLMEINHSIQLGKKVFFYVTESDLSDILIELCKINNIDDDEDKRKEFINSISDNLILYYDQYDPSVVRTIMEDMNFDEFYIDYLDSSIVSAQTAAEKSTILNNCVRFMIECGKEFHKFVWINVQAKLSLYQEYSMDSYRESTALGNAATICLINHRNRSANKDDNGHSLDSEMQSDSVIDIIKLRHSCVYAGVGTKIFYNFKYNNKYQYTEIGHSQDGEVMEERKRTPFSEW